MKFVFDFLVVWCSTGNHLFCCNRCCPTVPVNEASARDCAAAIFQGFHPTSDWALFDQGGIEPEALAHRIATRTGLSPDEVRTVIEAIPPHLVPDAGTVALMDELRGQGHQIYYLQHARRLCR